MASETAANVQVETPHQNPVEPLPIPADAVQIPGSEIFARMEVITPEIAAQYLQRNIRNRRLRPGKVRRYARDMRNNRWHPTHQGGGFYKDGILADFQHRLEAIVLSGKPVKMMVFYNLDPVSHDAIDVGAGRSAEDFVRFEGYDISRPDMAVAYALLECRGIAPTPQEAKVFAIRHLPVIQEVSGWFEGAEKRVAQTGLKAACVGAYYNLTPANRERLHDFALIVSDRYTKASTEHDEPAKRLRKWLTDTYLGNSRKIGGADRREVYFRTETALNAFLNGIKIGKQLRKATSELFPLPEEQNVAA